MNKRIQIDWGSVPVTAWPLLTVLARRHGLDGVRVWLGRHVLSPAVAASLSRHELDRIRRDGERWASALRR